MTRSKVWYYKQPGTEKVLSIRFETPVTITAARAELNDTNANGTSRIGFEVWCGEK